MTTLYLIRHGQTDWNLEGRYQGQADVPLNATGRAQAEALATQLQGRTFMALYTSDLQRARETADILARVVALPVQGEPRLREINQGEWEGQLVTAIKTRYTELWAQRTTDPANLRPPGGETVAEVAARMYAALDDIAYAHPNESVLIVSHGLALATVLCRVQNFPLAQAYQHIPENATPVDVSWG